MKKIKILSLIIILLIIFMSSSVCAASLSLSTSASSVYVGDTVSVTVSFGQKVSACDVSVSFDTSKFVYSGVSTGNANFTGSKVVASYYNATTEISSITFTFKAIAVGSSNFKASCSSAADINVNKVTVSGIPSKAVSVKEKPAEQPKTPTQTTPTKPSKPVTTTNKNTKTTAPKKEEVKKEEPVKSNNANLSSVTIDGFNLEPQFNKDTTKYSLNVNEDVKELNISASTEDTKAKYEILGNKELDFGRTTVTIKTTAEDRNYKRIFYRY